MQTEPVAPLRQAASGPILANLDLSLAFPLADDRCSFLDRLEAAEATATPVDDAAGDDRRRSSRTEKEEDRPLARPSAKKGKAEPEHDNVSAQPKPELVQAVDATPREAAAVRQADDAAPTDATVDADGGQALEQSSEHRPERASRDARRAARGDSGEEASKESAPCEPSARQTRLEAESSRRTEVSDHARASGDEPTLGHGADNQRSNAGGGNAWQEPTSQRQGGAEPAAREASAVKSVGAARESQGPSTAVVGDRVGQVRGGSPEAGRAKQGKPSAPRFPVPQSQESTMVLRTGKALAAALRGEGDVRLNLSPEELGRVQIRMHSDREGVSVVLGCERPETVASLESGVAGLRRSLEEQGVRVKEIVVEGPRPTEPARQADPASDPSAHDRPASGSDQGARDDGRQHLPARREAFPAAGMEEADHEMDTVVVDGSVGTLLASLGAAGVTAAIDTVV